MVAALRWILPLGYVALCAFVIIRFDGTGDPGDSITHYLYARYAPAHPELFFHHWAKPLFVMLAAPFAQFGFVGMKVFNALVSGGTLLGTYRLAARAGLRHAILAPLFCLAAPRFFTLTFSGLTEPLFACLLVWALVCLASHRMRLGAILLSFLPFVRSEGLVMIGVVGLYLLLRKEHRTIPWLLLGTVVYGLAGWPVHGDPFWPLTAIPYAELDSPYGSGTPFHFIEKAVHVLGVPLYGLFLLGTVLGIRSWWHAKDRTHVRYLVGLCTWAFIAAHTVFWWAGIFNSMGLTRVLTGIVPLMTIVALAGLERAVLFIPHRRPWPALATAAVVAYVLVFPVTPNPSAISIDRDLRLREDQLLMQRTAQQVVQAGGAQRRVVAHHPYLALELVRDPFDTDAWLQLRRGMLDQILPDDIVVWDDWFAPMEGHVALHDLTQRDRRVLWSGYAMDRGRRVEHVVLVHDEARPPSQGIDH